MTVDKLRVITSPASKTSFVARLREDGRLRRVVTKSLIWQSIVLYFITAFVPFISISYYSYWQKTPYESLSSLLQAFFSISFILIVASLFLFSKPFIFHLLVIIAVVLSLFPLVAVTDSVDYLGKIDVGFYTYVIAISLYLIAGIIYKADKF